MTIGELVSRIPDWSARGVLGYALLGAGLTMFPLPTIALVGAAFLLWLGWYGLRVTLWCIAQCLHLTITFFEQDDLRALQMFIVAMLFIAGFCFL
jgi:hypothetical protein